MHYRFSKCVNDLIRPGDIRTLLNCFNNFPTSEAFNDLNTSDRSELAC